ncbi:MAG: TonB-dependent receptor [Gammaproteobacteria bacterium]
MSRVSLRPIAAGLLFVSLAAVAAEQAPIIVTATRTAQIADESLAPVIVIDRAQIVRSQAVDIAGLLREHAGLDIGRNGGPGQPTSLFIRGTESNHVLVMVDGVKINPATIGGAPLQNIDPDLIQRIEIVKGPRSALYGSEAVGGVINIITRRAATGLHANAYLGAGRYDTRKAGVGVHKGGNGYHAGIDVGYTKTNGFPSRTGSDIASGYDNRSINLYLGKHLGGVDVELSHWQAGGTSDYLDYTLAPLSQDYANRITALKLHAAPRDNWTTTLHLSQAVDNIDQNQSADFAHTRRNAVDWQNNVQLTDDQLLTAGLSASRAHASSRVFGSGFDKHIDVKAFYVQDDLSLGRHRLLLAARHTHHDAFGGRTTWDAEYGYHFTPRTRLSAAIGTAFRAPDATDLYGYGGDPNLQAETSRNLEVGFHHHLTDHQSLALSAFDNRVKNLIEYDLASSKLMNIGRARIRGIEASYDIQAQAWGAHVEAIAQNPTDEVSGELLARRAKHTLTASVFYDTGRYRIGADWLATGKRKDSAFSSVYNAGYSLLNITTSMRIDRQWTLQGRVENLTDKHYTLADGYKTAGRSLYVELRYGHKG